MLEEWEPEKLLDVRLRAMGLGGLLTLLRSAQGAEIGNRFRIGRLLAAGRQAFVFSAMDDATGEEVVVKQAAFDYRKPIRYREKLVLQLRAAIEREWEVLQSCQNERFPKPIARVTGPAIVEAAKRNFALEHDELFVVQEKIDAKTLRELAFRHWRGLGPSRRESAAKKLAADFWRFWKSLFSAGWLYTDVSPNNLMIERTPLRLRVVDAGSVIRSDEQVLVSGFSPAFTTPNLFTKFTSSTPVPGTAAVVLPMFAKMMYFLITLREPLNGVLPDLAVSELFSCSEAGKEVLADLLGLDAHPEGVSQAERMLTRWTADAVDFPRF